MSEDSLCFDRLGPFHQKLNFDFVFTYVEKIVSVMGHLEVLPKERYKWAIT